MADSCQNLLDFFNTFCGAGILPAQDLLKKEEEDQEVVADYKFLRIFHIKYGHHAR